ncbi:hypothetical protein DSO57_1028293 [Entomophthora muscae]|uniref:Uncharacterized protein n=1 Tax=Entomophthora muscae TaxID=34485 RepID=A0ACC2TNK4_9FUNG|nr:hypothetical protein DSO57_1028293 [Entomophthora muscae]
MSLSQEFLDSGEYGKIDSEPMNSSDEELADEVMTDSINVISKPTVSNREIRNFFWI